MADEPGQRHYLPRCEGTAIAEYQHRRQTYYEGLKHFGTFGRGWTRRVTETTEAAMNMV